MEALIANRKFSLVARVSADALQAIELALQELVSKGSITRAEEGILVKAELRGANARELNRALLSALRQIVRKAKLRAQWTSGGTMERFFVYGPKGTRRA